VLRAYGADPRSAYARHALLALGMGVPVPGTGR
jgi:hypothetical protein